MKTWDWTSVGLAVLLSVASSARADEPSSQTTARPKSIRIPVNVAEAHRGSFESLNLFVSTDRGNTWEQAETITPNQAAFHYRPAEQGTYWFACQTVGKDGRKCPESVDALAPMIAATFKGGSDPELTLPEAKYFHGDVKYLPEPSQIDDQPKQQDDRKAKPIAPIKVPEYYTGGDDLPSVPPFALAEMSLWVGPRAKAPGRYQVALGGENNTLIVLTDTATGRCWVRSTALDDDAGWHDLESPAPAER